MNNLFDQIFLTRKIARQILKDNKIVELLGLNEIKESERERALRPQIGYVLAMYTTFDRILKYNKNSSLDDKWVALILSRTKLTKFGEKTFEEAAFRYMALRKDIQEQKIDWNSLSLQEQFIEVCSTVYSVEIMEEILGGMPVAVCKSIYNVLIPKIFEFKEWNLKE